MYQLSRTIAFILFSLILISTATHSAERCNFDGRWSIVDDHKLQILLHESESKITSVESYSYSPCGTSIYEGTTNGRQFTIKQHMSDQSQEICRNTITYTGQFTTDDCTVTEGTMSSYVYFIDEIITTPFTWYRSIVKIQNPNPNTDLIITAEPRMPALTIEAILTKSNPIATLSKAKTFSYMAPPFTWHANLEHIRIKDTSEYKAKLPDVTTDKPSYTPDFSLLKNYDKKGNEWLLPGSIMGGYLTIEVELYKTVSDKQTFIIKGTNPGRAAIEKLLVDPLERKIACAESRYMQFDADVEGGIGFPNVGKNSKKEKKGGVGIMQIHNPAPPVEVAWNWKKNIERGQHMIADAFDAARSAHTRERLRLNDDRLKMGLSVCPAGVPTNLTDDQVMREALQRYNCGVQYRWEPRDAPDCVGKWVVYHSAECRSDENYKYIDAVLNCKL